MTAPPGSSPSDSFAAGGGPQPEAATGGGPAAVAPEALRAGLEEFALRELVRQHRGSFPPLWSVESWAKLLIWLALNSGCPADALATFATALEPARSARLRRLFFSRELEAEGLRLQADPADGEVLVQALAGPGEQGIGAGSAGAGSAGDGQELEVERILAALERVGLGERVVVEPGRWQRRQGVVVLPFR